MAHYYHTRKQRLQRTNDELQLERKMALRTKDFDEGIIPDIIDGRTKREKLQSQEQKNDLIRKLVYNLFDNDPEDSEEYIQLLNSNNIDLDLFQSIYDDLEKRFKGKNIRPRNILQNTIQLADNFTSSGNTMIDNKTIVETLDDVKDILNNVGYTTDYEKQDTNNKIDGLKYLYSKIFEFDDLDTNQADIALFNRKEIGAIKQNISDEMINLFTILNDDYSNDNSKALQLAEILARIKKQTILQAQKFGKVKS